METAHETLTLSNFGGGAADEYFQEQLNKVLENVLDPNTDPKAAREINLKFKIKPDGQGGLGTMTIHPSSKLVAPSGFTSTIVMGKGADGVEARELRLYHQETLFSNKEENNGKETDNNNDAETETEQPESEAQKVTPIR